MSTFSKHDDSDDRQPSHSRRPIFSGRRLWRGFIGWLRMSCSRSSYKIDIGECSVHARYIGDIRDEQLLHATRYCLGLGSFIRELHIVTGCLAWNTTSREGFLRASPFQMFPRCRGGSSARGPARPALCSAEALEIGASSRESIPSWGFHTGSLTKSESTT